ncbi:MAG: UDP-N-acetylmuramoyl-L-alanine--D-glutamate ligase [Chloroflexota bacterium]
MALDLPFNNLKILIVGLARTGSAVAKFLATQGAKVTVTDIKPAEKLVDEVQALAGLNITFHLGYHPDDALDPPYTDLIVVNPGIPLEIPYLQRAQAQGLHLTTESRLFSQLCPAPIIGISGSSGKTTTTTMTGLMLERSGYQTYVGGNIGLPLITALPDIQSQDRVVLELSSFQLEYFHPANRVNQAIKPELRPLLSGWSPTVGTLLNITPNHLDRHGTMDAYIRAKAALVQYQNKDQLTVIGNDDDTTVKLAESLHTVSYQFGLEKPIKQGVTVIDDQIILLDQGQVRPICSVSAIQLRGRHNLYNILAACTTAYLAGATIEALAAVINSFTGVPHRLENVATRQDVVYVNDSIATSPERMMAALNAYDEPIILLAGGKDKNLPWDDVAQLIIDRVKHLILFGQDAALIADAVQAAQPKSNTMPIRQTENLEAAVLEAATVAQANDIVLLSPGCTSYDAYPDFVARGDHFRALVNDL